MSEEEKPEFPEAFKYCSGCGAVVYDWEQHKKFHNAIVDGITELANNTRDAFNNLLKALGWAR
ncbi:hypothetical protein [Nocardia nova]|uniref:hypothetical protein n=1 Tax=Nocardia nova TaxID=37330 RepID=UPI002739E09E|nr:hypothetical protein [Nocardia nova]